MKTKKLVLTFTLVLAILGACKKESVSNVQSINTEQSIDQANKTITETIRLQNGMLVFSDEKQFNSYLMKVQNQTRFEIPNGFQSLWNIYCSINEAEKKLADAALKMKEFERSSLRPSRSVEYNKNLDILKQKEFEDGTKYYKIDINDYRIARFVNRFGFVVIGNQLRRYTEENCYYTTTFERNQVISKTIPMEVLFSYGNRTVGTTGSGCGNSWNRYHSVTSNGVIPPTRNFIQVTQTQYDRGNGESYTFSNVTGEHYRWSYWSQTFYPENTNLTLSGSFSGPRSPFLSTPAIFPGSPTTLGYVLQNPFNVTINNVPAATVLHFEDRYFYWLQNHGCFDQATGYFSVLTVFGGGAVLIW